MNISALAASVAVVGIQHSGQCRRVQIDAGQIFL